MDKSKQEKAVYDACLAAAKKLGMKELRKMSWFASNNVPITDEDWK